MPTSIITKSLENCDPTSRIEILTEYIRESLAEFLEFDDKEEIAYNQDFVELGVTSMEAVNFKIQLETELECELKTTLFFDYPKLDILVKYVLTEVLGLVIENSSKEKTRNGSELHKEKETISFVEPEETEQIVIIAIDGVFPSATTPEELWQKSITIANTQKKEEDKEFKFNEFSEIEYYQKLRQLGISEKIFATLSKKQKLAYITISNLVHKYDISLKELSDSKTGVFFATDMQNEGYIFDSPYTVPLANDISFRLNFNGPSEIINTFCTSIYVAMHRAIQSIRSQECEQAIVGGVNTISKKAFEDLAKQGVYDDLLSSHNATYSFSNQANGFVRSEGTGGMVLTTLSKALDNSNTILAVIKASEVGHGGKNFSLEAPKATGIKDTIISCIQKANIDVDTIDYIEAHGIANPLADAIELTSINDSYTSLSNISDKKWHISTIKPVTGHPELVSGMASLIKVIKAFEYKMIPGITNLSGVNTEIPDDNKLCFKKETENWKETTYPKRAALNSYAIGGVNAHVVLERYGDSKTENITNLISKDVKEKDDAIVHSKKENEIAIASALSEIFDLQLDTIDRSLSPMDYGFDSIKIIQFIRRINDKLKIEIKIGEALGVDSFDDFFNIIETKQRTTSLGPEEEFKEVNLSQSFSHHATLFQKGLWLAHEVDPLSTIYNLPILFLVKKKLKAHIVVRALAYLLEEFPVLRVYFGNEGEEIVQKIHPLSNCLDIDESTFTISQEEEFKKLLRIPFDLQKDCLLRTYLRTDQKTNQQFLVFIIHHTILDGLSGTLFMKFFWETYTQIENDDELFVKQTDYHFFDFTTREYQYMNNSTSKEDLQWWQTRLSGISPIFLPYDLPQKKINSYKDKENVSIRILGNQLDTIKDTAKSIKVSISILMMAGFKILLHKLTQQEDITIATPVEGRQKSGYENSLGCFVNVILMRSILDQQKTVKQNIEEVKERFLESLNHAAYPLTGLLAELSKEQKEKQSDGVNIPVSYTYQNIFDSILDSDVLSDEVIPIYDIYQETEDEYAMEVYDFRDELQVNFKYKKDLFTKETMQRHLCYFMNIIDCIIEDKELLLSELELIPKEEAVSFMKDFDLTNATFPKNKTIVDLFEEQVKATPRHIAVTHKEEHITYQDLNIRVNQLAQFLRKKGIAEKDMVVLTLERSIDMIVSILSVIKTGASYVPIDPSYPINRIKYIIDDVKPRSIICTASLTELLGQTYNSDSIITIDDDKELISHESSENLNVVIDPDDVLYVIYTSGTTGSPKGVCITHRNVVRLFKNDQMLFDFNENDVWTLFHSYCFDFSVWEMYGALVFGGRLVIVSDEVRKDTDLFCELLISEKVTILNQTPSFFYAVQNQINVFPEKLDIRYVIFGGEALQPTVLKKWNTYYPDCKLINMYGITETTVHVTYQEITTKEINEELSVIGLPIPTLSCYVLDKNLKMLPHGVAGELYVGGEGLAKGYLNQPELTLERFIQNPFKENTRLYKTGDIVKRNHNNRIEYLGRIDQQVKIRGYRIELAEIENVLLKLQNISQCVVVVREVASDKQLIAYITVEELMDKEEIFIFLKSKIPQYMIPNFIQIIKEFVLTSNGKIDKKRLPAPDFSEIQQDFVAPTNEIEKTVVTIFEEILEHEKIGILDNFFDLGGHSLLVIKTINKINTSLSSKLKAQHLFRFSTPQKLALCIKNGGEVNEIVDLQKEIIPNSVIYNPSGDFVFNNTPSHIFVTGGTGFVGAFLLSELLENTDAKLYCLTRARSEEEGFAKLKNIMLKYDLWHDGYEKRIKSIIGDIGAPRLGLSSGTFDQLSRTIDVIYHNAAHMNHIATYQDLKPANVGGTLEIIRLAGLHKIKPIHYTSTLAVFNNTDRTQLEVLTESSTSENEIHYENDGYQTSKWVGENVVLRAQQAGIPCVIYRLGLTTGDGVKGRLDTKQWFYEFMKSCILMDAMINRDLNIALPMMPVDVVAKSLVCLSLQKDSLQKTFHLVGKPSSLYDIFKNYSYHRNDSPLKELSMYDWLKMAKSKPELSIPPFMQDYLELTEDELKERRDKELKAKLQFDNTFTEKRLKKNNIVFSNIDSKTSLLYFSYVIKKENLIVTKMNG